MTSLSFSFFMWDSDASLAGLLLAPEVCGLGTGLALHMRPLRARVAGSEHPLSALPGTHKCSMVPAETQMRRGPCGGSLPQVDLPYPARSQTEKTLRGACTSRI